MTRTRNRMRAWPILLPVGLAALTLLGGACQKQPDVPQLPPATPSPFPLQPLNGNFDLPPDTVDAIEKGLAASQQQDFATVRSVIKTLAPRAKTSADLSERLATLCRAAGQVDLAWKFARIAVDVAPESPSALLVLSVTESDLDWVANVSKRLQRIKQLAPASVEPRLALASSFQTANQYPSAEAEYRELIAMEPDNPAGWGMLANVLYLQKKYDEARKANAEADRRGRPDNPAVWVLAARIDLDQADAKPDIASEYRARALKSLEAGCARQPVPAGLFFLGAAREATGDLKGARQAWETVYQRMPEYPRLRTRLARLRVRLGDTAGGEKLFAEERKAVEDLDQIRRLVNASGADLASAEGHRALAKEAERRKMVARARLEWQLVERLKPGDPQARARLAVLMKGVPDVPLPAQFP